MMGSFLSKVNAEEGGMVIACIGFAGTLAALVMSRSWGKKALRAFLLIFSWTLSVVLVVVIPDVRVVQNFAYSFLLYFELFEWPVWNQLLCMIGGGLWGAAALFYQRRTKGACVNCGRVEEKSDKSKLPIWGKWATYIAVVMSLPYGIVRLVWAAGIPLGASDALSIIDQIPRDRIIEAVLGGLPICGGILTLGLIQKWGEVFPRWCLFLAGKRVPIWLVVVPAGIASSLVTLTGIKTSPFIILKIMEGTINSDNWGEMVPFLTWPIWGLALGAATLSYYLRRRSSCKYCGRM